MFLVRFNIASILVLSLLLMDTAVADLAIPGSSSPLSGHVGVKEIDENPQAVKQRSGRGNPIAGDEKSQLCQGCHGEFGNSIVGLIPKLAGQYAGYIEKQVLNYQAGTRTHQIMNAMAGTLDDKNDIADIAAYFASQKKMRGDGKRENRVGKDIFLHGDPSKMRLACVNCHGINGKGIDPKIPMFPVIGGQHRDYIRKQLVDFRDGIRTNSPSGIMNTIASSLTDDEIEALADYVSRR